MCCTARELGHAPALPLAHGAAASSVFTRTRDAAKIKGQSAMGPSLPGRASPRTTQILAHHTVWSPQASQLASSKLDLLRADLFLDAEVCSLLPEILESLRLWQPVGGAAARPCSDVTTIVWCRCCGSGSAEAFCCGQRLDVARCGIFFGNESVTARNA